MYRMDRNEEFKRYKQIVTENNIRTQGEFAEKYLEKFGEKPSQPKVSRNFNLYDIQVDYNTGYYVYCEATERQETLPWDVLKYLLTNTSNGRYSHEKTSKIIWLDIIPGNETSVAKAIYDYFDNGVSILVGYGCLFIRCSLAKDYDTLRKLVAHFIISD